VFVIIDFDVFSFEVKHQVVQPKQSTVDINKVLGTPVAIYLSQLAAVFEFFTQLRYLLEKRIVREIKNLLVQGPG
jgi:hypothetical protein